MQLNLHLTPRILLSLLLLCCFSFGKVRGQSTYSQSNTELRFVNQSFTFPLPSNTQGFKEDSYRPSMSVIEVAGKPYLISYTNADYSTQSSRNNGFGQVFSLHFGPNQTINNTYIEDAIFNDQIPSRNFSGTSNNNIITYSGVSGGVLRNGMLIAGALQAQRNTRFSNSEYTEIQLIVRTTKVNRVMGWFSDNNTLKVNAKFSVGGGMITIAPDPKKPEETQNYYLFADANDRLTLVELKEQRQWIDLSINRTISNAKRFDRITGITTFQQPQKDGSASPQIIVTGTNGGKVATLILDYNFREIEYTVHQTRSAFFVTAIGGSVENGGQNSRLQIFYNVIPKSGRDHNLYRFERNLNNNTWESSTENINYRYTQGDFNEYASFAPIVALNTLATSTVNDYTTAQSHIHLLNPFDGRSRFFRQISWKSDRIDVESTYNFESSKINKKLWRLIGVVEGPPPFAANGNDLTNGLSSASFIKQTNNEKTFRINAGFSFEAKVVAAGVGVQASMSYQREHEKRTSTEISQEFKFDTDPRYLVGYRLYVRPSITRIIYKRTDWRGNSIPGFITVFKLRNASLEAESYKIRDYLPDANGTYTYYASDKPFRTHVEDFATIVPPIRMNSSISQSGSAEVFLTSTQSQTQSWNFSVGIGTEGEQDVPLIGTQAASWSAWANINAGLNFSFTTTERTGFRVETQKLPYRDNNKSQDVELLNTDVYLLKPELRRGGLDLSRLWWYPEDLRRQLEDNPNAPKNLPWCLTYIVQNGRMLDGTPLVIYPGAAEDPCEPPVRISASARNNTTIDVSWTQRYDAMNGYTLVYGIQRGGTTHSIPIPSQNTTFYSLSGLSPGQDYFIRLYTNCQFERSVKYAEALVTTTSTDCPMTSISIDNIQANQVNVNWQLWNNARNASQVALDYRIVGESNWQTLMDNASNTRRTLTGLQAGQNYEVRARAICGAGRVGLYSDIRTFRTLAGSTSSGGSSGGNTGGGTSGGTNSCARVSNINVAPMAREVQVTWGAVNGATDYGLAWRPQNDATASWRSMGVMSNSASIRNLRPGTSYELRITSYCNNNTSAIANTTFVTNPARMEDYSENSAEHFQLYPNPNNGLFRLLFNGESTSVYEVKIMDVTGRLVTPPMTYSQNQVDFDLQNLNSGAYIIQVQQDGSSWFSKFIKN